MLSKILLSISFFVSSFAVAHDGQVPEFFYQVGEAQTALQGELGYIINDEEIGASDNEFNAINFRAWAQHGITDNFAIQFAVPMGLSVNSESNGVTGLDGDFGIRDLELNLLVHRELGSMILYYGVEGMITLDKTGSGPNFFSTGHTFNPYVGLSMGEAMKYGAKFTYRSITTNNSGNNGGDFDYDLEFFGEINKEDSYLLGGSLGYIQDSGMDDSIALNFYGRLYLEKFTLIPRISYMHGLDSDIDSQLKLNASLGIRKTF